MAKTIEKSNVLKKLEEAQSIRDEANERAKEIELSALQELKDERKSLLEQVDSLDKQIEKITGKPASASGATGGGRKKTEPVILAILNENPKFSCAKIQAHPQMIKLYGGGKVPSQAIKLAQMVEEGKIKKEGKPMKTVYSLA